MPGLPASAYTDPAVWAAERQAVFARSWLCIGHTQELPDPGDARTFEVAGWSLIVVRAADGALHGHHNVCRHRAGPLLWHGTACSGATRLRCRYHGWTYAPDGRLLATPGFGDDVDRDALGLVPVALDTWRGLVFAWIGPDPAPFADHVADLDAAAAHVPLETFTVVRRVQHTLACNWKVYVENYQEGLHIRWLHPGLAAEVDTADYRVVPRGRCVVHHVAPRGDDAVNAGLWVWQWPTLALNVYAHGMSVERIVPTGPASTTIDYLFAVRDPSTDTEAALAMSAQVTAEDVAICEAVQRNLASGAVDPGPLSTVHEQGVAAFHALLHHAMARATAPTA